MGDFICSVKKGKTTSVIGIKADTEEEAREKAEGKGYTIASIHAEDDELELLGDDDASGAEDEDNEDEDTEVEILSVEEVDEDEDTDTEDEDEDTEAKKNGNKPKKDEDEDNDDDEHTDDAPGKKTFAGRWFGD